jgi:hypothetical protein
MLSEATWPRPTPASDVWLPELGVSNELIGDVPMDQGNLAEG